MCRSICERCRGSAVPDSNAHQAHLVEQVLADVETRKGDDGAKLFCLLVIPPNLFGKGEKAKLSKAEINALRTIL